MFFLGAAWPREKVNKSFDSFKPLASLKVPWYVLPCGNSKQGWNSALISSLIHDLPFWCIIYHVTPLRKHSMSGATIIHFFTNGKSLWIVNIPIIKWAKILLCIAHFQLCLLNVIFRINLNMEIFQKTKIT